MCCLATITHFAKLRLTKQKKLKRNTRNEKNTRKKEKQQVRLKKNKKIKRNSLVDKVFGTFNKQTNNQT